VIKINESASDCLQRLDELRFRLDSLDWERSTAAQLVTKFTSLDVRGIVSGVRGNAATIGQNCSVVLNKASDLSKSLRDAAT